MSLLKRFLNIGLASQPIRSGAGFPEDDDPAAHTDDEEATADNPEDDESLEGGDEAGDGDEQDKEEADGRSKSRGERARIAAILNSEEATGREKLARFLAFETDSAPGDAHAILAAAPKASPGTGLDARMAAIPQPDIGRGGGSHDGLPRGGSVEARAARILEGYRG
ncbi:hypothetical protein [Oceanibaculum sp.]|uniref:hypothetical protein n=1 Tax=Oceanibaculum sp. TaxID=1903597 RepID=UPI0025887C7E|nr:hypothetical protein [Oceanibaculum sp.]MCH2394317.1 DNA polymerase V family protein [Oceanibaculum sp.]